MTHRCNCTDQLQDVRARYNSLLADYSQLCSKNQGLRNRLVAFERRNEELSHLYMQQQIAIKTLDYELEQARAQNPTRSQVPNNLFESEKFRRDLSRNQQLNHIIDAKNKDIYLLQQQLRPVQHHLQQIHNLKGQLQFQEQSISSLKIHAQQVEKNNKQLQSINIDLQNTNNNLQKSILDLQKNNLDLHNKLESLQKLQNENQQLKNQLQQLNENLNAKNIQIQQLEQELQSLQLNISQINKQNQELRLRQSQIENNKVQNATCDHSSFEKSKNINTTENQLRSIFDVWKHEWHSDATEDTSPQLHCSQHRPHPKELPPRNRDLTFYPFRSVRTPGAGDLRELQAASIQTRIDWLQRENTYLRGELSGKIY